MRRRVGALAGLVVLAASSAFGAGEFDRLEGARIAELIQSTDAKPWTSLTIGALDALPAVLPETRSGLLLVKTDQGNYARLLASPALRKPPRGDATPIPVLLLERFDTFEPGRAGSRLAKGAGMVLFDGFEVDLDSGIVVPEGQGGDLVFRAQGAGGPRLEPRPEAALFSLTRRPPPSPGATTASGPSPGKTVVATDFSGRYRLFADGRFTGLLVLSVGDDRIVSGSFRSEPNGTTYPVRGQTEPDPPHRITFTVKFPRTEQEYDGRLWTEGKWALAGTFTMLDRTFGFFALREGANLPTGD